MKKKFMGCFMALCTAFTERLSEDEIHRKAQLYFEYLKTEDIEAVQYATDRAIRELKFFPKIKELLDYVEQFRNHRWAIQQKEQRLLPDSGTLKPEEAKKLIRKLKEKL